jgi:hypothetical protein
MSNFEPPTGAPQEGPVEDPESEAKAQAFLRQMYAAMQGAAKPKTPQMLTFTMVMGMSTAVSLVSAVNYMDDDQTLEEDQEVVDAAFHFFKHVCGTIRDLLLPVLANNGIATPPELWTEVHGEVMHAIDQINGVEEEEE